jgi:carboxylesterase type B
MPDVFDFPNTTELTSLIASYTDNNTAAAQNIISAYPNTSLAELGKGFNADTSAPDAFYIAEAVYSDLYMHLGRRAWLKEASKYQPTWGYVFAQQPPLSTLNLSYEYPGYEVDYYKRLGVYHGSELSYVFGEVSSVEGTTKGDTRLAVSVMRWWINFAWEMDPNYDTSGKSLGLGEIGSERVLMMQVWLGLFTTPRKQAL